MDTVYQSTIHICRVYTPPETKTGVWILVDRLWPRGLKKDTLAFDLWLKDITPSTALRQWFHADVEGRWEAFAARYTEELQHKDALIQQIRRMAEQDSVTLFYAAKDTRHNHALILQRVLCGE